MVKVVLDTNVVVSSMLVQEGSPASIFRKLALGDINNFTTHEIIEEIKEVLARPRILKRISLAESEFVLHSFEELSEKVYPEISLDEIKDDPDDNKILECAIASTADYIISGDAHLLKLREFRGIKIVSPAEFILLMDGIE